MKKFIVSTSIYPPSEAYLKFAKIADRDNWTFIIVGDLKTPHRKYYKLTIDYKNVFYLSPEYQERSYKKLSDMIGWNCIQRRNIGIVEAYNNGADIIALTDDDNVPLDNWGKELLIGKKTKTNFYISDNPVFDPIGVMDSTFWHRGFPLQLVSKRIPNIIIRPYKKGSSIVKAIKLPIKKTIIPSIQADFWNGDPDIDAVNRIEFDEILNTFDPKYFPISSNKPSPFNSQNTFLSREVIPDYFLFPRIGRQDDIWASYYVQSLGFKVVYSKPSVYQKRNPHNLIEDMKQEMLGYEKNLDLVLDLAKTPANYWKYLPKGSYEMFEEYRKLLNYPKTT